MKKIRNFILVFLFLFPISNALASITFVHKVSVAKDDSTSIDGAYNRANLRTSLGFELIYPDGLTLSPLYEKTFALKGPSFKGGLLSKGITERFIIKIVAQKKQMEIILR